MRKAIPRDTESKILLESARRCSLCYGFDGDLGRKQGQIAHIDQDPYNNEEVNLVYLCLKHHDEYDSTTSQSKGVTEGELSAYKRRLLDAIAKGDQTRFEAARPVDQNRHDAIRVHDDRIFAQSDSIMPEGFLRDFLDQLQTDNSYIRSKILAIDHFRHFFADTGNQYINDCLSKPLSGLLVAIDSLLVFLAYNFFCFPRDQRDREDIRLCLYPDLNVDRGGSGEVEEMSRYDQYQKQLDALAGAVRAAYTQYRRSVKATLIV